MNQRVVTIISRMNVGGPAVLVVELANSLNKAGFSHTLITGKCEPNEKDYLLGKTVPGKVIYINRMARSFVLINEILAFASLVRAIRREQPDLIHTHMSKAGFLGRVAGRIAAPQARLIHTYHGHLMYGYFPKWKSLLIITVERLLARLTNKLIAITHVVQSDLLKAGVGKKQQWELIRVGVHIEPRHSRVRARSELCISDEVFCIVWIGRFADVKNPMFALEAFNGFEGKDESKLIMLGAGDLLDDCMEFAERHNLKVSFPGWSDDVYKYLPAADLFLLTSKNEGMGMVVLEAATQAVPTLSTNVGGVSEFINDGKTGFFAEGNVSGFVSRLDSIFRDRDFLKVVGEGAMELVTNEFSIEKFVNSHIILYSLARDSL